MANVPAANTDAETAKTKNEIADKIWDFNHVPSSHPESMSRFCLIPDEIGVTYINDLTRKDAGRIQKIAKEEFASMAKKYSIAGFHQEMHISKKTIDETAVFEVPLETLVERDRKITRDCESPLILQMLILYLKHNDGSKNLEKILEDLGTLQRTHNLINKLNRCFYAESSEATDSALHKASGQEIVGVLKHFISRLPDPLLTHKLIRTFSQLDCIDDPVDQMKAMKLLNLQLPPAHRASLTNLLNLIGDVINDKTTLRGLVSMVEAMAPYLFPFKEQDEIRRGKHCFLTKMMILNRNVMNAVPPYMMNQIRKNKNQRTRKSPTSGTGQKMTIDSTTKEDGGVTMLIDWPDRNIRDFRVNFTDRNTARDIILRVDEECIPKKPSSASQTKEKGRTPAAGPRFLSKLIATSYNELCTMDPLKFPAFAVHLHGLFETGGNIESRRLRPDVLVMNVYAKNPSVEKWVIKCQHLI